MKKYISFFVFFAVLSVMLSLQPPAAVGKEVVVYSTNLQKLNEMVAEDFEKATGIKVHMFRAGSGITIKKIKAEKERPLGDVGWGLSKIICENNRDLWQPYKSVNFDATPAAYRDPSHLWLGQMVHVMVLMYHRDLVKDAEAPRTWSDLLNPKWKDKVAYCNPNNSGSAYTQLSIMLALWGDNEAGWKKVETLLTNAKVTQQSSLVPKGVNEGEFPIGITMEYAAHRFKAGGANIAVVYPEDGTLAYTEAGAIIKGCKNPEAAKKFVDFTTGKEERIKIVKNFLRRPARSDIDFTGVVEGMPALKDVKLVKDYDQAYWTEKRPEALGKVKEILLRVK